MNSIHPTAVVAPDARLGARNVIGPFVVIAGGVVLGDDNWIGAGAIIGTPPEVRSFNHGDSWLEGPTSGGVTIGDRNVIREASQIHAGWADRTRIGNDVFVMNSVYIAHDCVLGDEVTLAAKVSLGGHVVVRTGATLGMAVTVHQRRIVGDHAMVGMSSAVTGDVEPFSKVYGVPARPHGINTVGMSRAGFSDAEIAWVTAGRNASTSPASAAIAAVFSAYDSARTT